MFCYIQIHDIQIDVQAKKQIPYLDVVKQCINYAVSLVPPEKRNEQSITSARVVLLKFGMKYDTEGAHVYTLEHNDTKYEHTASSSLARLHEDMRLLTCKLRNNFRV